MLSQQYVLFYPSTSTSLIILTAFNRKLHIAAYENPARKQRHTWSWQRQEPLRSKRVAAASHGDVVLIVVEGQNRPCADILPPFAIPCAGGESEAGEEDKGLVLRAATQRPLCKESHSERRAPSAFRLGQDGASGVPLAASCCNRLREPVPVRVRLMFVFCWLFLKSSRLPLLSPLCSVFHDHARTYC